MQSLIVKLTGESSLLLRSDRGANPLAQETKEHKALTKKRTRTDDDNIAIARSEYMLGFYPGKDIAIPAANIKSALVEGAKMHKLGSQVNRAVMILADLVPVKHSGPANKDKMWETPACIDCRSVKVGQARLMRYRPRLNDWTLTVEILFDENMLERQQVMDAMTNAGKYIGIGDYRPAKGGQFGRFSVADE
jgi:hypothetical protein